MSDLWQIRGSSSHTKQRKPVESPKKKRFRPANVVGKETLSGQICYLAVWVVSRPFGT
jgi:hypothetical protein